MFMLRVMVHELAHMWFGDLVTMRWWNDLWLKESFADFMAACNMSENPAFTNYKNTNLIFLEYLNNAYQADIRRTTHPIAATVNTTEDAANVFDRISYQKGASFIKLTSNYLGRPII